jgi:putative transcriptional regulator
MARTCDPGIYAPKAYRASMLTVVETTALSGAVARILDREGTKPLPPKEPARFEAARDLGAELLQSIREMKSGKVRVAYSPATEAREKTDLSQSQFAALLGVSVRTLQGWEQGRKQPSGAARTLLTIARTNPKALLAVAGK